jgi:alpha-ketoglutarate-dependent taurine dioxygenase
MRTGAARQLAVEVADRPFDLARGPLLRAQLLLLDADGADAVLVLTLHHIVCDGWSLPRLVTELAAFYRAAVAAEPLRLPPLSVQVADFAAWQRRVLTDERLEAQLAYWRERLAGDPRRLRLPFRRSPSPGDGARHRGGSLAFNVSPASSAALLELARRQRVTPFMACLAVFKTLLYRLSGETEVVVGTDFANRGRAEIEPLIGFFVNLLVLRTDLGGGPRISELLNRVRETALGAYAHHEVPFERLVEVLAPERSLRGQAPLFRYLFVFGGPPPSASLPGVALEPFASGRETARFELGLFMHETELGFAGSWIYQSAHYHRSDIELLSRQLVDLFEQFARMPDARLEDLDLYTSPVDETKGNAMPGQEARLRPSAFKRVKPKMVSVPQGDLVKTSSLDGSVPPFPLVIEPAVDGLDPCGWGAANRTMLEDEVSKHGALLFRGFDLGDVPGFEAFVASICPTLFGDYGDLPQADEGKKVYHSTPYPKTKTILFHNESSHTHQWPLRQFFYCVLPAQSGGETPIVDCRRLYRVLDPAVRERFARLGLIYQRNFTEGLDVSWQGFFRTDSKDEVETHCRRHGIEVSWQGERLRTRQRAPAVASHPRTGEPLFFNQILLHHISCMEPEVRASLATLFDEDSLPRNVYYGDGTPIEDALVEEILGLYWRESVSFPWQAGDALMVDNMLVAHARNPFEGPRKIAVAMGEMFQQADLGPAATPS